MWISKALLAFGELDCGYNEKIVRLLDALYTHTVVICTVRVDGSLTDWLETLVGVLQDAFSLLRCSIYYWKL